MNQSSEISEDLEIQVTDNPRELTISATFPKSDKQFITLVYDLAGLLFEQMVERGLCEEYDETAPALQLIAEKRHWLKVHCQPRPHLPK